MKQHRLNKELIQKVSYRVKQLREERNISQETFYIDTDIHIARIESGKSNITISTLSIICSYFDINLSEFFDGIQS